VAQYQILYWKDVPAQVKVFPDGGRPTSRQMPDRFQVEIDRIAMQEGLVGTDDYLNQWHWTAKQERPGNVAELLDELIKELEADWDSRRAEP
jgi:hypothetical protein